MEEDLGDGGVAPVLQGDALGAGAGERPQDAQRRRLYIGLEELLRIAQEFEAGVGLGDGPDELSDVTHGHPSGSA